MKKITLKITGMHCVSCAMNIDGALEDLGVKSVSTNYAKGQTEVEFDSKKISVQDIQLAIIRAGYESVIA